MIRSNKSTLEKNSKSVQALPWLQLSALKSGEEERRERAQRLALQKAAAVGVGFGPPPQTSSMPAKVSCVCL